MRFDVITLFPGLFGPFLDAGMVGRAVKRRMVEVILHDLRAHGEGSYRKVDDAPYGGGAGMVLLPGPLFAALEEVQGRAPRPGRVVLLSPQGRRLEQETLRRLAARPRLVLVCGRYEGLDERFVASKVDEELSIGDYVLSGGELAAMVVIEGVTRLLPGALNDPASAESDSFSRGLLGHPQYTRPEVFRRMGVPRVLLSGDHEAVARWRHEMALEATRRKRPDLLKRGSASSGARDGRPGEATGRTTEKRARTSPAGGRESGAGSRRGKP